MVMTGEQLIKQIDNWSGPPESMAFWWLGQASVIIKVDGKVIYIDPYLSPEEPRQVQPLLTPSQVTNADFILGTHDHGDHIDPAAFVGIAEASRQGLFVVPEAARQKVIELGIDGKRVAGLNAEQCWKKDGLTITAVKAKHEFFDKTADGNYPYLGYIIQVGKLCIYHCGDTLVYDGLLSCLRKFDFTVMFVPINGRDAERFRVNCLGNMTFQEAVDLTGEVRPKLVVPIHHSMFAFNTENPQNFVEFLNVKFPGIDSWAGQPGEKVEIK